MSSDYGWVIQNNSDGDFVLQHYFASADEIPNVEDGHMVFKTLEEAVLKHNELDSGDYPSEYGLSLQLTKTVKEQKMLEVVKAARKPFFVEAVRVTAENMDELTKWAKGEIRSETLDGKNVNYIHVRVHLPRNEKQTKAYVGDWILYAGTGFKVYPDKAFKNSFDIQETIQNVFEMNEQPDPSAVVSR